MVRAGGRHVLAEFKCTDKRTLNNGKWLEKTLADVAAKAGFSVKMKMYKFTPYGITAVAVLGESHVIIHTYPEHNHVSLDAYTCFGDPHRIAKGVIKKLNLTPLEVKEFDRGEEIVDIKPESIAHKKWCEGYFHEYKVDKKIVDKYSKFQRIRVILNSQFGKMLFLDNDLQFSGSDEEIYNEELTKRVGTGSKVLLFGGDGSVLKSLLKLGVSGVTVVERDADLIETCKNIFDGVKEAFANRKVATIIKNGLPFIRKNKEKFDAILIDMIPEAMGMSEKDFYREFLPALGGNLTEQGILSFQLCSAYEAQKVETARHVLKHYFKRVEIGQQWIPSYGTLYKFIHAHKQPVIIPSAQSEGEWISGFLSLGPEVKYHVKKKIFDGQSNYQKIDIIENDYFGRMLFLDNDLQIADKDAHIYNSNLASPIIHEMGSPDKVLVLGGGDGGIANELLRYKPGKVIMVDIDREVIEACKKFLPKVCGSAFSSPKVKVIIGDAFKYLKNARGFDEVIYDLTMHPEAIIKIDREKFLDGVFSNIRRSLKKGGIVTMQCCPELDTETIRLINKILKKYFTDINLVKSFIPSYCVNWIFASARVKI